jgi:hypothetical protein
VAPAAIEPHRAWLNPNRAAALGLDLHIDDGAGVPALASQDLLVDVAGHCRPDLESKRGLNAGRSRTADLQDARPCRIRRYFDADRHAGF